MKKTCKTKGCENKFIQYSTIQTKCVECRKKQIEKGREVIAKMPKKEYNRKVKKPKKTDYKEIFRKYWGYEKEEIILCWYSGKAADDIHHILYKSQNGKDEIENLIPLARDIHDRAHFKKEPYIQAEELFEIVRERIKYIF